MKIWELILYFALIPYNNKKFSIESKILGVTRDYKIDFEGVANFIENQFKNADSTSLKRWAKEYMDKIDCDSCHGSRLRQESLYFKINNQNIADLANKDISDLFEWFSTLDQYLSEKQLKIAEEIIKEINFLTKKNDSYAQFLKQCLPFKTFGKLTVFKISEPIF